MEELRRDYKLSKLNEVSVKRKPFDQFELWFLETKRVGLVEPNAFCLSTTGRNGRPSSRILLLKGYETDKFIFYTDYLSKKSKELGIVPYAAMLFYWPELERQLRIEGKVTKVPETVSDKYFSSRPFEAKISAIVSKQSSLVGSRNDLDTAWLKTKAEVLKGKITRPATWGGFQLKADYYEFWQGRENRLHDRLAYKLIKGKWKLSRLSP